MIFDKLLIVINSIKNRIKFIIKVIYIVILLIYIFFTKDYKFCIFLNSILTIAVITAFIYVSRIRTRFVEEIFRKEAKILNIISVTMIILNIIIITIIFSNVKIYYLAILYSIQSILEYCQIKNVFKLKINKMNSVLVYLNNAIVLVLPLFFLESKKIFYFYNNRLFFYVIILINILVGLYVGSNNIASIFPNNEGINELNLNKVIIYVLSIITNYISIIALLEGYEKIAMVYIIIKIFIFYDFYNYIISKILYGSFNEISKNIILVNKRKKNLNSILVKRNKVLKETNLMVKKSKDNYHELIESIYGAIFLFLNDKLIYVNNGFFEILGTSNNEILGMYINEFIYKYFKINLDEIKRSQNHIASIKIKDNNLDVEIFLTEVNSETKILYIQDITEKNNNTKIIEEMEEYLKEDEFKKEFFANISHELKTPINLIFSALQVNQIYLKENNIDGFTKNNIIVKQNCNRLIRTINNFIDANKISEGYITLNNKIYNIVEIVESTSIACNKYIKLIDNTLIFDAEEEEIYVNCDKEMIRRIILNILSNSVKYGRRNGRIDVNVCIEKNNTVNIKVKNNGLKIDERTIPYIFDKFTKLNKAFNRIKEGSGLGMFLSKALIELQGGHISLITNDNGNEFTITFPIIERVKEVYIYKELEINALEEKVDVEFSDIYIE